MKSHSFLLLLVTFTIAGQDRVPVPVAPGLQDRANAQHAARLKTDDRIQFYRELIANRPSDLKNTVLLAGAYLQKMRETTDFSYVARAAALLEGVIRVDPKCYDALRLQTEVQLEYHRFFDVVESSKLLIKVAPADPWNYGTMGDALIEIGDYDRGADAFQKMVDLRPDLSSYNRAAHYRFLNNDVQGAIDIMRQAINAGSSSPENVAWCLVELGHIYAKTGQLGLAEDAYGRALRYFATSHSAFAGMGKVQAMNGATDQAIVSYKHAQSITPLPEYAAALFDLYRTTGRKKDADEQLQFIDLIEKLMQVNKEKANRNLSLILSDHDHKIGRALQLAQAELEFRHDVYTYDVLGWALYKNGKYEEAQHAAAEALKLNTPEPSFYYHAGMIAAALGRNQEAEKYLRRAMALNPKFDFAQAPLAARQLTALTVQATK